MSKNPQFETLCNKVHYCTRCERMENSSRILSRAAGPLDAEIMFIGEAPGRLGADASHIPFHGDQAGHNFEELISFAGLTRARMFVTNAALCNPKDSKGNNSTPTKLELTNCSIHLKEQIEIVNPKIIVTLGAAALEALKIIKPHQLRISDAVRTARRWNGRILIPLYHPGRRAMIHRSMANQRSDYQFVADEFRKLSKSRSRSGGITKSSVAQVAKALIEGCDTLSYFGLHKLMYLTEYRSVLVSGRRLTDAFFLRQKDGPYCTDLQLSKLQKAIPELEVISKGGKTFLQMSQKNLFCDDEQPDIGSEAREIIDRVIGETKTLSDAKLKTKVYLTKPMRKMLRQEQVLALNLYNAPIDLDEISREAKRTICSPNRLDEPIAEISRSTEI